MSSDSRDVLCITCVCHRMGAVGDVEGSGEEGPRRGGGEDLVARVRVKLRDRAVRVRVVTLMVTTMRVAEGAIIDTSDWGAIASHVEG